jgi:anti-sigma28 factor (negative regulator of flagellin synthesis)
MRELRNELLKNDGTYQQINNNTNNDETTTFKDCLKRHKQFNDRYGYDHVNNLPYLYSQPKMHKSKSRFIAGVGRPLLTFTQTENEDGQNEGNQTETTENDNNGAASDDDTTSTTSSSENSSEEANSQIKRDKVKTIKRHFERHHKPKCSTTIASATLSKQLNWIIDLLRRKDETTRHEYKRCFIIRKSEEIFNLIKENQAKFNTFQPRTFDFTTLYTKLKHSTMIDHIEAAIDEAIIFKNYLERNNKEATLLLSMIELFDKAKLMDHVKFIIENTFVANSLKNIYQQKIGIPMGTNCAPELANLVLYDMEAKHIDNLVSTNRMLEAINLRYTKRYIDDIIVFNTEPIPMTAYDNLQYTEQTEEDGSVIFLGAKLQSRSNRLYISLFDKAKEWNFNVLKYPSADSNTPQHQGKGIYVGELRRYQIMVNSLSAFKQATSNLTKNMATRGYNFKTIKTGWEHFMKKYKDNNFSKRKQRDLRHWYRRMVK